MSTSSFYGTPNPLMGAQAVPVSSPRAPATTDLGFGIGQFWIFQPSGQLFYLASIVAGSANWLPVGVGPGSLNTINGIGPAAGNFVIEGSVIAGVNQAITVTSPAPQGPPNSVGLGVAVDGATITINGAGQLQVISAAPALTLTGNAPSTAKAFLANNFNIQGIANGALDFQSSAAGQMDGQVKYDNVTIGVNGSNQLVAKNQLNFSLVTVNAVSASTVDIPIPNNQATTVYVLFTVVNAGVTLAASDIAQGVARVSAGVVTVINGDFIDVSIQDDPALEMADYTLVAGGGASTVRITVTGVAGQTLMWHAAVTLTSTP